MQAGVAAPGDPHARTGLGSGRDADVERFNFRNAAVSIAILANGMELAGAAATLTGDLEFHFAADLGRAAGATAGRTALRVARLDAIAVTDTAGVQTRKTYFFHRALHGFSEADIDLKFEIGSLFTLMARLRAATLSAENLAEKIAKTGSAAGTPAAKIESTEVEVSARLLLRGDGCW